MFKAELIGNLGKDAQVIEGNSGKFVSFNVAHSSKYTRASGEEIKNVTWVSCILNGEAPRLLPYLKKGVKVYVRGNLSTRIYINTQGNKEVGINCNVSEIELCGSADQRPQQQTQTTNDFEVSEDPFGF